MTFTNVTADAVNTIEWLSAANTTIAVPVYQRQYSGNRYPQRATPDLSRGLRDPPGAAKG